MSGLVDAEQSKSIYLNESPVEVMKLASAVILILAWSVRLFERSVTCLS